MSDQEIFDAIGVPEDRRPELAAWLHAWSRLILPGPNYYAAKAVLVWNAIKDAPPVVPDGVFDPSGWIL